jgi:hypothetical protein
LVIGLLNNKQVEKPLQKPFQIEPLVFLYIDSGRRSIHISALYGYLFIYFIIAYVGSLDVEVYLFNLA